MTLGITPSQPSIFSTTTSFCEPRVAPESIYALLHRECSTLFADEMFADLFEDIGRRSVPPMIVAVVMVLQRLEGLSDREAVERFTYDIRWKYAAGGLDFDYPGFVHTVLVDMRERLRNSYRPDRIFEAALSAAKDAGLVSKKRALDSTPLYDAVATMDTVTLIRSAIRNLLKVAEAELAAALRQAITSGDDYASAAKPQIDWDDKDAQAQLVDSRAKDAYACLLVLDGKEPGPVVTQAATLLATVVGQDLEEGDDKVFQIARRVAKDRVISTVDAEARHGHKTSNHRFDGYKAHIAIDPDSEIITAATVTPGNAGDASAAEDLIAELLEDQGSLGNDEPVEETSVVDSALAPADDPDPDGAPGTDEMDRGVVYGDNAYGTGPFHERLEQAGIDSRCKTQNPTAAGDLFSKDRFDINLVDDTVTCLAGVIVAITRYSRGGGVAHFGDACASCSMRTKCTTATAGRSISINAHEEALARARKRQRDPRWRDDYRATRPKVERKIAHLMRRKHGGRRARVRGTKRIDDDFRLLAAAVNLARLAVLGAHSRDAMWAVPGT
ncbi:MAG: transposase [Acidimicrobiales bacterium]